MSIEAMKQALIGLERCAYHKLQHESIQNIVNHYAPALRQAIARAESTLEAEKHEVSQEPVAWRTYTGRGYYIIDPTLEEAQKNWPDRTHQPLYTHPQPKREWVWLTDEELKPFCDENYIAYGAYTVDFIKAIEAKLKEKNNG